MRVAVGIGPRADDWIVELLAELARSGAIKLVLVLVRERGGECDGVEGAGNPPRPEYAFVAQVSRGPTPPAHEPAGRIYRPEWVQWEGDIGGARGRLRERDVDVFLDLLGGESGPDVGGGCRHGSWSIRLDGSPTPGRDASRTGLVYPHGPTLSVEVCASLDGGGPPGVVDRATLAVDYRSVKRTLDSAHAKAITLILRGLNRIELAGRLELSGLPLATPPPCGRMSGGAFAGLLRGVRERVATRILARYLRRPAWQVGIRRRDGDGVGPAPGPLQVLPAPPGHYYADPFLAESDGRAFLFFEDYSYARARGVISRVEVREDLTFGPPRVVLERAYHLSYPFVFAWDGRHWMVPETAANGCIDLFRAERFPDEWVRERTMVPGVRAVDATVLQAEGRFWLFAAIAGRGGSLQDELHLFHAPSPLDDWIPHPWNPIVCDVTRARPAGNIIECGGRWIRPAQDCSGWYGRAIMLNQIDVLTPERYVETPVQRIGCEWRPGAIGTHTISRTATLEAVDWWRMSWSVPAWWEVLIARR
jgi:hypothetical protein